MTVAHRFEQILSKVGQPVSIRSRTAGAADEFNRPSYTWADAVTEDAILTAPTVVTFADMKWSPEGQMEARDRIGYFNGDSVIAENDRVILSTGERYEVDVMDSPVIFGQTTIKVCILRRLTEQ